MGVPLRAMVPRTTVPPRVLPVNGRPLRVATTTTPGPRVLTALITTPATESLTMPSTLSPTTSRTTPATPLLMTTDGPSMRIQVPTTTPSATVTRPTPMLTATHPPGAELTPLPSPLRPSALTGELFETMAYH